MDPLELSLSCTRDPEVSFWQRADSFNSKLQKARSPVLEENVGANAGGQLTSRPDHSTRSKHVNSADPDSFSNAKYQVSKRLHANGSGSDNSDVPKIYAASTPSISPKDVIRAVGQKQFWKARSVILRQWQIFSDQVFELHKLIKVQQLLAEIPNVLSDKEKCCGTVDVMPECDAGASAGDMTRKTKHMDKKEHSPQKDVGKSQLPGSGLQPGVACNPSWSQVFKNDFNGPIHMQPFASMPVLIPGGMTPWIYPSSDTWPWMEPMRAQAGVFLYPPAAETHSAGSLLGRAYGSAVLGSGSQIWSPPTAPFRFPGCEQWPEFLPNLHSRYGPTISSCHHWNNTRYNNFPHVPIVPDLMGSWYAMQCNLMNHNHRSGAIEDDKDVRLDSVASMTISENASMHTVKRLCLPGTNFQKGMNGSTHESDAEGMDRSVFPSHADGLNGNIAIACEKAKCGGWDDPERPQSGGDSDHAGRKTARHTEEWGGRVIKVVPYAAGSASRSAAGILLSIQQERQQ